MSSASLKIRGLYKADFDHLVSVLDRWWGGPAGQHAHPLFFYEFGEHALVAEMDGEIVGFLLGFLTCNEPRLGYIHLVGIHPDHRRRGVGKALYERFTAHCVEHGAKRIKTITAVGAEGQLEFHAALGFTATEVEDYAGPSRARIVFTRDL
ncbi:MAG: GNAT family N-acetyltransferase [Myxococcales bacterium]|nr:GNAT family N-acetyltransferase [Myxococcales bacterium]